MAIIGPGMTDEDYTKGRVSPIDVFEGQIKGWILAFAKTLASQEDSGLAILLLTASVIEPMGGALMGGGKSGAKFCSGFVKAFPDIPGGNSREVAELVCHLLRDGLFHEGFIKAGLILERGSVPVSIRKSAVVIDPVLFLEQVGAAFTKLCDEIRSDTAKGDLRKAFNVYWSKKDDDHGKYMTARFDPQIESVVTSTSTHAPMPATSFLRNIGLAPKSQK